MAATPMTPTDPLEDLADILMDLRMDGPSDGKMTYRELMRWYAGRILPKLATPRPAGVEHDGPTPRDCPECLRLHDGEDR